MAFAVGFVNATTSRASTRGIARIYEKNMNAMQFSLISNLRPKVSECPRPQFIPLCFSNDRYPFADARQIFKGNTAAGAFRTLNKVFGYYMVNIFGKARFLAAALCQEFATRSGLLCLQLGAQPVMPFSKGCDLSSAIGVTVAIGSNILNAEIDAKKIVNIFWRWFIDFAGRKQVKLTIDQAKVRLATVTTKQFLSAGVSKEGNALDATVNRPNGNFVFVEFPGQDTAIKSDTTQRSKLTLYRFAYFVGIGNLSNTANDKLGTKIKSGTGFVIGNFLKLEFPERAVGPSDITNEIASGIRYLECTLQAISLCFGRCKLYLSS